MQDHGKCPVTKEELNMDDIVPVKTNKVRLLWYANEVVETTYSSSTSIRVDCRVSHEPIYVS